MKNLVLLVWCACLLASSVRAMDNSAHWKSVRSDKRKVIVPCNFDGAPHQVKLEKKWTLRKKIIGLENWGKFIKFHDAVIDIVIKNEGGAILSDNGKVIIVIDYDTLMEAIIDKADADEGDIGDIEKLLGEYYDFTRNKKKDVVSLTAKSHFERYFIGSIKLAGYKENPELKNFHDEFLKKVLSDTRLLEKDDKIEFYIDDTNIFFEEIGDEIKNHKHTIKDLKFFYHTEPVAMRNSAYEHKFIVEPYFLDEFRESLKRVNAKIAAEASEASKPKKRKLEATSVSANSDRNETKRHKISNQDDPKQSQHNNEDF